jgi:hypothetical protein
MAYLKARAARGRCLVFDLLHVGFLLLASELAANSCHSLALDFAMQKVASRL